MSAKSDLLDAIKRVKSKVGNEDLTKAITKTMPGSALSAASGLPFETINPAITPPAPVAPVQKPQKDFSPVKEAKAWLGQIPYQAGSQILDMAGFVTRIPAFAQASKDVMEESKRAYPSDAPQYSSMADIESASLSDIAWYGLANSNQVISSALSMALPRSLLNKALLPAIGKIASVSPKVSKLVTLVGGPEKAAQFAAGWGGGSLLEAGAIAQDSYDKTGEMPERYKVLPWAIVAGAAEIAGQIKLLSAFSKIAPPGIVEEAARKTGRGLVSYVVDYAKDMGMEGATEFIQTILEEAAVKNIAGAPAIQSLTSTIADPDARARAYASGLAGAAGGGMSQTAANISKVFQADPTTTPINNQPAPDPVLEVKRLIGEQPEPAIQQQTLPEIEVKDTTPEFEESPIEKVKKAVSGGNAETGGNATPQDVKAIKFRKQVASVWEGIGVTGNDMDNLTGELFQGKKLNDLTEPELQQLYQTGLDQAAQGNILEQQQTVPTPTPMPMSQPQMQMPLMQPTQAAPQMSLADRVNQVAMAQRPEQQQPMSMSRQPMQQTQNVTRQITPEDIAPFADQPIQPEQATNQLPTEPGTIYETTVNTKDGPKKYFAIRGEGRDGFGDSLFDTREKAEANKKQQADIAAANEITRQKEAEKDRIRREKVDQRAAVAKEKRDKSMIIVDDNYLSSLKPIQRGRIEKVLRQEISHGGQTMTRRELIESGRYVRKESFTTRGKERFTLVTADDKILDIPKVVYDAITLNDVVVNDLARQDEAEIDRADKNAEADRNEKIRKVELIAMSDKELEAARASATTRTAQDTITKEMMNRAAMSNGDKIDRIKSEILKVKREFAPKTADAIVEKLEKEKRRIRSIIFKEDDDAQPEQSIEDAIVETLTGQKPAEPVYGDKNTLVTKSRYDELKAKFNSKVKNITSGIDPELMAIAAEMAVFHIESGARKFADFAKAIIGDVGEGFRPYLKSAYLSAKYYPGAEKFQAEMDSEADINVPEIKLDATTTPDVGKAGDVNVPALSDALMPTVESWINSPMTNGQLKKVIAELGIDTNDTKYSHKLAQEAIEGAIVRVIRKRGLNSDQVLKMYQNQPALNERTVTSIMNQAYSTPAPLSMMLVDAIGFDQTTGSVYEPTAGNGLLLSGIRENEDGTLHDYRLNELEKNRNDQLKSLFPAARITNQDAMEVTPERKVDLVMTNPPFGSLKGVGRDPFKIMTSGEVETEFVFTKLDHAIAAKALQSMKDNGKAALILGAELDKTDKAKSEITGQNARFMDYLYNQYNVTGHFELSGNLYEKQGAAWPVIVVTIEGRKSFPKNYVKSPKSVERAGTWNEVKTAINKIEPGKYLAGESRLGVPGGEGSAQTGYTGRTKVSGRSGGSGRSRRRTRPTSLAGAVSAAIGNKQEADSIRDSRGDNEQTGDRIPDKPEAPEATIQGGRETGPLSDAEIARQASIAAGVVDTDLQSVHEPESKKLSIGALVPANLKNPMQRAMKALVEKIDEKSVDEYVAHQLGYDNADQMGKMLSAQQVDALGLAFYNFLNEKATIIADQTGVGKGRVAAAAIAWAVKHGYIPVFTTETAGLFNDIYRDLKNIKEAGLVPFIMNADASMSDADGNIVHEFDKKKADKVMKRMEAGDFSDFGPDGEYDYIAMTYSQVNTEGSRKMNALLKAPSKKIITILDESHNAAGTDSNQGENIAKLIDSEVSKGVMYLSATWSKTPDQMAIYHRAFGEGMSIDEINIAFERGGVAMQEMTVASMADKGAYVRREQSFANVEFTRKKTTTPREIVSETEKAEKTMDIVREIIEVGGMANMGSKDVDLQDGNIPAAFGDEVDDKGNAVTASVDKPDSPFSQVHNYVGSFLTSLKADAAAESAIESIKKGIKPVIVIQNTMGSAIDQLIETGAAKIGEGFGGTFADVLDMMLEKTLIMPVKNNFTGKKTSVKIPLESMSPAFQAEFKALKAKIKKTEFQNMPFSPIDYIANKIKQAGYSMGELTGRDKYLDYGDLKDGKPTLKTKEIGNQAEYRKNTINEFNSGVTDAFLFNVAGATGMSIHSSVEFKDQRQREMLILQPFGDINKFMQAIGRTHRVGEVVTEDAVTSRIDGKPAVYGYPSYKYLQSSLGMEIRSGIALEKKMKSLNAQTSSNEKGHQSVADVDVMNKYGLAIMRDWLLARPQIMAKLDLDKNSTVEQITGRIAVLKQEEQEQFWQEVVKEYQAKIQQLDAAGENDLVAMSYTDSNAKTLSKKLIYGQEGSLTSPPIYLEHVEMTMTGKPTSLEGARQRVEKGMTVKEEQIKQRDAALKVYLDRKRDENAEAIANGKDPSFNISTIQAHAERVKADIAKLVPGTIISNEKGVGIITDVYLDEFPEGSSSFPWNPSSVNIKLATPGTSGNLIFSLAAYRKDGYGDDGLLSNADRRWREDYEQEFKKNSTKKVKRYLLTGDLYRAAMMTSGAAAIKFQRDNGTFDFAWLQKDDKDNATVQPIKEPPIKLTDDDIKNHTPERVVSSDLDGVRIRPSVDEITGFDGKPVYIPIKAEDGTPGFWVTIRKTNKKYAKALYSNKELLSILKTSPQSDGLTEVTLDGKKYLQSAPLPQKLKVKVMLKVNEIIKSRGGSLVNTKTPLLNDKEISEAYAEADRLNRLGRQGSNAILNIFTKWAGEKLADTLESAYNFLVRGSGSFIDWLKTVSAKAKDMAAKIWKDARRILEINRIGGIGKRGANMNFKTLIASAKESIAIATEEGKKPLPAPAIEELTEQTAEAAFELGQVKANITATKRKLSQRARTEERVKGIKAKLAKLRKLNTLSYEARRYLVGLASKLPSADRGGLIRAIASANTPAQVGAAINKIDELYTKVAKRQAMARFKEAIRGAKHLRPEFQKIVDDIRSGDKRSWIAYEALDGMIRYLADNETVFIPGEAMAAMESLRTNKPKTLTPETINLISQTLETLAYMSKVENERIFADKTRTLTQAVSDINKHIPTEKKLADQEGQTGEYAKWFFGIGSMQYEAVTEMMGEVGRKIFYSDMREGERKSKEIWFKGRDILHDAMTALGIGPEDKKTSDWLEEQTKVNTSSGAAELTRDERMNLVASLKDPSTRAEIIKAGFKLKSDKNKTYQMTSDDCDAAIKSLSKAEMKIVDTMREFVNGELKNEINDTWVELAGYEKAMKKDYWPRTRDANKTGVNQGFRQYAKTALEELGIFKERQTSSQAVMIGNAMDTYQNHLKKSSTFAGLAIPIRNIELAMGKGGLSQSLENQFGKKFVARIEDQIQAIADLGHSGEGVLNRWLSKVLRNISVGFLGFNLRSALKQFGGLFTAATEISGAYLAGAFGKGFNEETRKEMYAHSAILRDRYDSTGAKLAGPSFDSTSIVGNKEVWTRRAMKLLENFDRAVSQIVWEAAKQEIKDKNPGIGKAELMRETAKRAESIVSRTQNVTSILDMSGVGVEARKNSALKAVTMFQSQGNSIYNIIRRAIRNFKTGKTSKLEMAWTLTLATMGNAIWSSMIGNLVSGPVIAALVRGGGDDEDEIKKYFNLSETAWDIAQENINMFYGGSLLSPVVRNMKRLADKDKVFVASGKIENATESVINNTLQGVQHIMTGALNAGEKIKSGPNKGQMKSNIEYEKGAAKLIVRGLMPLAGLPSFPVSEAMKILYSK
jgi:hypothetical protein